MTDRVADIRARLELVRERIRAAGGDDTVEVLAVTKVHAVDLARDAVAAGLTLLGENYAAELADKADRLATEGAGTAEWHMIGPIQRNKVKLLAGRVAVYQTVDRVELAETIARRHPGAVVFCQVNTTGEAAKSGVAPHDTARLVERCGELGLTVDGLMTLGPTSAEIDPRPAFAELRALVDRHGLARCSMGMSRDLDAAVAEGSTMVRVGTDLFGPRPDR